MPYNAYTKMSRDDVHGDPRLSQHGRRRCTIAVVANTLPFPFNIRAAMRVWDWLYFTPRRISSPMPSKSAEWNRGAFLVQGPAHCGACHTPKTFLGGDKTSEYLHGS